MHFCFVELTQDRFVFSASPNGIFTQSTSFVPLTTDLSSLNASSPNSAGYSCTTPSKGTYFAEICAGLVAGQSVMMSLLEGDRTVMGLAWGSSFHDGPYTACRGGLVQFSRPVSLQLSVDIGTIFSDNSETILSVFSLSSALTDDALSRTVHAVGSVPFGRRGALQLVPTIAASPGVFDEATNGYTCTSSGLYFFSLTAGSSSFNPTRLELDVVDDTGHNTTTFVLTRDGRRYHGATTVSREFLFDCPAGTKLVLNVNHSGVVDYSNYQLITFSSFPYLPKHVASQAWVLLNDNRTFTQGSPPDPFHFNIVSYNADSLYDVNTKTVRIKTAGYYYVYMSSGTTRDKPLHFSLQRNGATLMTISHDPKISISDGGVGHGGIVALNANDVLKVVAAAGSYSYSSASELCTSFFGMILYSI